jgi:glycosyltransferase involved in cell wall biosynthesis
LHVAQINFLPVPKHRVLTETFEQWPSLVDIAETAASAGTQVSVIQVAARSQHMERGGVDYHFVRAHGTRDDCRRHLAGLLGEIKADVLHIHGLGFAEETHALAKHLSPLPILFQDHADRPPRRWQRPKWRRWYAVASGVAFTAPELALPFTQAKLFGSVTRLFAIPESSSRFTRGSRAHAWAETGLYGDPCVLWVGHLSEGKDPMSVLHGIAQAAELLPGLQLWCAFGSATLLETVQRCIGSDPRLRERVHLLGKVTHAHVEALMRAADLYVSGSIRESCSYALLEAMACGLSPVITDIPAHRALAGDVGNLWRGGDPASLAEALLRAAAHRVAPERIRSHFDAHLSFEAVGRRWADAYQQLLDARRRGCS